MCKPGCMENEDPAVIHLKRLTGHSKQQENNRNCVFCHLLFAVFIFLGQGVFAKSGYLIMIVGDHRDYSKGPSSWPLFVQHLFLEPQMNLNKKQLLPKVA